MPVGVSQAPACQSVVNPVFEHIAFPLQAQQVVLVKVAIYVGRPHVAVTKFFGMYKFVKYMCLDEMHLTLD
jgi:hypothetical protein